MKKSILAAVILSSAQLPVHAAAVIVDPSYIKFSNVQLEGKVRLEKKAGYLLKIGNEGDAGSLYEVSAHSCNELGIKLTGGYTELPDLNWLVGKSTDIYIPAHSDGYFNYLDFIAPYDKRYAGQRWEVVLKVAKKNKDVMNMEVLVPLWIETKVEKAAEKQPGDRK